MGRRQGSGECARRRRRLKGKSAATDSPQKSRSEAATRIDVKFVINMGLMRFGDLRGKVAIVTGASRLRGIGAATCRALAAEGCGIFFTAYPPYDATAFPGSATRMDSESLATELRDLGVPVAFLEIDLAQ